MMMVFQRDENFVTSSLISISNAFQHFQCSITMYTFFMSLFRSHSSLKILGSKAEMHAAQYIALA